MAGTVERLPRVIPELEDEREPAAHDHPIRRVTIDVARDPAAWSPETAEAVRDIFDGLAAEWHTRQTPGRSASVVDAIERGGAAGGRCLEVGCGTGLVTPELAPHFERVVSLDLAMEMLRLAPPELLRVRGDQARLPFADGTFDVVAHVNALLFPDEVARVLAPHGSVVWVNTRGPATPIYLDADDVAAALPGAWTGVASEAGAGTWAVLRRA